jgi:hypothetical protein
MRLCKIFTHEGATKREDFEIAALMNWVERKKQNIMEY